MSIGKLLAHALFPKQCAACGDLIPDAETFCFDCFQKINFISTAEHDVHWHRSLFHYDEPMPHLIHQFKYGARLDLAPVFAKMWLEYHGAFIRDYAVLIPIPMAAHALRVRTYNQSLELALALSRLTGVPVLKQGLVKVKRTPPQASLSREARIKNLRGAYACGEPMISFHDRAVLLIDDVYTTGTTLVHAAETIRTQSGVRAVGALTVTTARHH